MLTAGGRGHQGASGGVAGEELLRVVGLTWGSVLGYKRARPCGARGPEVDT